MKISEVATEDLKSEAMGLYQMIYVNECYGTKDILFLQGICAELEKRGWISEEVTALRFVPKDEDEE